MTATPKKITAREMAIQYAKHFGWPVLPVLGKKPTAGDDWPSKASNDPQQVDALFSRSGHDGIGLLLGEKSGIIDVEIDAPEGEKTLLWVFGGTIPKTPMFGSTRGNHRLFRYSDAIPDNHKAKYEFDGLEFRVGGEAAQSVIPISGGRKWLVSPTECAIAEIPPDALDRIRERLVQIENDKKVNGSRGCVPKSSAAIPAENGKLDIERFLSRNNVQIIGRDNGRDGANRWFIECPRKAAHTNTNGMKDCVIAQEHSGKLGGHCLHTSCGMGSWQDIREAIGPLRSDDFPQRPRVTNELATPLPANVIESDNDPHRLASVFLDRKATTNLGIRTLVFWRGEFWRWGGFTYESISESELRGELTAAVKHEFDLIAAAQLKDWQASTSDDKGKVPEALKVTRSLIANVTNSLESMTCIPNKLNQPCWLVNNPPFDASEVLVTKSGLLHLPSLATGLPSLLPPTPMFFASTSLGCEFDPNATCPTWLSFLLSVWPDDQDSIDLLAEWIGYLMLPDVSHHKILLIVGPMRSGKGTIGRILKLLLGQNSVANPTLGSLAGPFGLWPLLNKSAAVISDARLSGKVDGVAILERLLSISGGDPQNIDRKCLPTVTAVMMAVRFTILTNELMRLTD